MKTTNQIAAKGPAKRVPSAHFGVEAEERRQADKRLARGLLDEERQDEDQRHEAAQITEGETGPGDAADLGARSQTGKLGVGEDQRKFGPDEADPEGNEREGEVRAVGHRGPEGRGPCDIKGREGNDPGHPPPGGVGERAHDGTAEAHDQPGYGQA